MSVLNSFSSNNNQEGQKEKGSSFLSINLGQDGERNAVTNRGTRLGSFEAGPLSGSWRSPAEVFYPSVNPPKPLLSPYTSLAPSPARRIRGLATLNLHRAEYDKVF